MVYNEGNFQLQTHNFVNEFSNSINDISHQNNFFGWGVGGVLSDYSVIAKVVNGTDEVIMTQFYGRM